ncbi:response regulator [Acetivibrio clariflavus]|uniref:response regulator n=1 Tax=Acetivibrio clariflavus TaxID=288965 RepID=UPI0004805B3A|nr:response regulator [Acetivibrio clariflavus]
MATILIVDDSSMARRNLKNILISEGHTVVAEATNGVQAFVEYEKHKPDLVTMDISMPILNGIDGTKKILLSYPDARIIMVSALNQKLMVLAALQNGAKHYIIKPFAPEKVTEVVNEVLHLSCKMPQNNYNPTSVQKQSAGNLSSLHQQQKDNTVN